MEKIKTDNQPFIVKRTKNKGRLFSYYLSIYNNNYFTTELERILENPDHYIKPPYLKEDTTTTVSLVDINKRQIVIKRYNIKSLWHGIKRACQPTRATRCWRSAHYLLKLGIATPRPIAMIERRAFLFRREGYYLYDYIPGPQGFDVFRDKPASEEITKIRIEKTAALINALLNAKISHGDMKASNFIYYDTDPYFIDLDAMSRHRLNCVAKKKKKKEILRFLENWQDPKIRSMFEKLLLDKK